jgi:hypothetical protein
VLDFADNLITRTIATGYRDARLTSADGTPRFRKELGRPSFVEFPARD